MVLSRLKFRSHAVLLAALAGLQINAIADFVLGDPPRQPKSTAGLPVIQANSLVDSGFSVTTTNREDVRSFYNAIYHASDGIPINSTAVTSSCNPGTNSATFVDGVLRRINWFRAMAGVPAVINFATTNNSADQLGALIMSASTMTSGTNLTHDPTNGGVWQCWSSVGSNACHFSNLALGVNGPDAITGYIQDPGANNSAAGHRRWILYPQTQTMGTGDMPTQGAFMAANATFVVDGLFGQPRPATRNPYVAWPPSGFVPYQVVYPRWSFAYPNANITNATISMTSNGVPISVSKETVQGGFAEDTLVWIPMGLNANSFATAWPFNGTDTVYAVTVGNVTVTNTVTHTTAISNFTYSVTVFDPAVPGAGYFPPVIAGTNQPTAGFASAYTFNSVSNSTSYQWRYAQRTPFSLNDGAEGTLANWTTNTESDYSVITTTPAASGLHAFQLIHSQGHPQSMTLNFTLWCATNTSLQFKSELEYSFTNETARVQISTNGGGAWFDVYTQAGTNTGAVQGPGEGAFSTRTVNLGAYASNVLQLRFLYDISPGSYYSGPASIVGWHFDDIIITNVEQFGTPVTNAIAGTNFQFAAPQPGIYNLQARSVIFTDFPLNWGPVKQVTALTSSVPVIAINKITFSNNQAKVDFTLQTGPTSTYKLLTSAQPFSGWSTDTLAVLTTNSPGSFRFTTTSAGAAKYYRIQSP